jgi:hypothetical protein
MGNAIKSASGGEKTVLDGTEGIPLSGSQWTLPTTLRTFFKATYDTLYGTAAQGIAGAAYPVDMQMYGFNPAGLGFTYAFDPNTYTFTITDSGSGWWYYRAGLKHTISGNKSVTLPGSPPAAGNWYIYIDATDGTLTASQTVWTLADTKVLVALIEWDNALTPKYILWPEFHRANIARGDHRRGHLTEGGRIAAGGGVISGYTLAPGTPSDVQNTFAIATAEVFDETNGVVLAAVADPDGATPVYMIRYRDGAGGWKWALSEVPFLYSGTYINWDDGDGTLATAATGEFLCGYMLATIAGFMFIQPQVAHGTLALAQAHSFSQLNLTGFPSAEGGAIYRIIYRTGSGYTSAKGRCRTEQVDAITASLLGGAVVGTITATGVVNTPAGNIAATTVQAAIDELDTEKAPVRADASESGTTRTNTAADKANWVRWTSASAKTFTINGNVAAATDEWVGTNIGANNLTIAQGTSMTLTGNLVFAPGETYIVRFPTATTGIVVGGAA